MQKHQAAPVFVRFRPTRAALLAALAGLVALAFGLFAPLSAQAGDHSGNGRGGDKPWICHPVEGKGENGAGWNVINPNAHSSHINEQNGAGKHTRKDGRTDVYASGGKGGPDKGWKDKGKDCYPKPHHTKTHHPKPHPTKTYPTPATTTVTEAATVTTTATTTATETTTTTVAPPATGATNPPVAPVVEPPEAPAFEPPAEAPAAAPVAEAPQQAPVVQNVVPQAATDGADLQPQGAGWTSLQPALIGAGALLLLAAGLLSARRSPTS